MSVDATEPAQWWSGDSLTRMVDHGVQQALLGLERAGWDSLCEGTGDVFYGRILTEDGLMVPADGQVMERATVVAALGQVPPWRKYEISDARFVQAGSDSVALVYRGTGYREPDAPAFVALMTSVYVRRGEEWRLALYQQTAVDNDAA